MWRDNVELVALQVGFGGMDGMVEESGSSSGTTGPEPMGPPNPINPDNNTHVVAVTNIVHLPMSAPAQVISNKNYKARTVCK